MEKISISKKFQLKSFKSTNKSKVEKQNDKTKKWVKKE